MSSVWKKSVRVPILATAMALSSCQSLDLKPSSLRAPAGEEIRTGFVGINNLTSDKKTVCAMTLNSDNEILAFQKHLNHQHFQFVELVTKDSAWLQKALQAKIRCDILVVSGHFGGSFFGDKGDLSLEDLENATCSEEGKGIFHSVKEVFLFGCNTLAGKTLDHRTPEEYVRVLIEDGFSPSQADQIAAFRYSPLGNTFSDRMSRVFSGVPRIYGFTSVGPSGRTVEPMLNKYLKSKDYSKYIYEIDSKDNIDFLKALKHSAVAQTAGADMASAEEIPRCVFNSNAIGESVKLNLADQLLKDPKKRLSHLAEISDYLLKTKRTGANRKLELQLSRQWAQDKVLKKDMNQVLDQGIKSYPALRLQMTQIAYYLGWYTQDDVRRIGSEVVGPILSKGLTVEGQDFLISLGTLAGQFIDFEMVKNIELSLDLLYVFENIKPQDAKIHTLLAEAVKHHSDSDVRRKSLLALGQIKPRNTKIHDVLIQIMKEDSSGSLRDSAAWALGNIAQRDAKILTALIIALESDQDRFVRQNAAWALGNIKSKSAQVKTALQRATKDVDPQVRQNATWALQEN